MPVRKNVKRNRKRKSRVAWQPMTACIIIMVGVALGYFFIKQKNQALSTEIRAMQRELDRLEKDYSREEARWNSLKSSDRLESSMLAHGIEMKLAEPRQVVHMNEQGSPVEGQISVAYLRSLLAENVAQSSIDR